MFLTTLTLHFTSYLEFAFLLPADHFSIIQPAMKQAVLLSALTGFFSLAGAATTFSPARPPAVPLAVRAPYLNSWLYVAENGGNGGLLAGPESWARFWK